MAFNGVGGHPAVAAASAKLIKNDPEVVRSQPLKLSPRQQDLDRRWAYYQCEQYAPRTVAWDGSRVVGQVEHDGIAMAGYVPPGFYVANAETLPIQFRRPTAPYHLCKVIVDRFTGLLFGQKRHPRITVAGDPETDDYINAVVEEGRLWPQMMQSRTFGGATGSAVVGFKILQGRPQFEVFDPRWCTPKFLDRANLILQELEYRYTFKQEILSPENGEWIEVDFWYRRVIDTQQDVIFEPTPVDTQTNAPPQWVPASQVEHSLGFCPVAWIQNEANLTDVDGDPDCKGIFDLCEAIDRLNSQSEKGILANCDPTVVVSTDAQMGEVRKGSSNALKLPNGGTAGYMEMTGTGVIQAREQSRMYRDNALEVAQCILENPSDVAKTATEIERNHAPMLARADRYREQYGEMGVKRLVNMVLVAAVSLNKPRAVNGSITRYEIRLPKKDDGSERRLGKGPYQATLAWPPYFEPSLDDATKAVTAAGLAKTSGLVDQEHATKFVAPYFQVEDTAALSKKIIDAATAERDQLDQLSLSGAAPDQVAPTPIAPKIDPLDPSLDDVDPDEVAEPEQAAVAPEPTPEKEADSAFNGAQVAALAELIKSCAKGEIPPSAVKEIILASFPIKPDAIDRMLAGLGAKEPSPADQPPAGPPAGPPA